MQQSAVRISLKERFETFIRTLEGFESIDDLLKHAEQHGRKRADYLLSGRKIIIEQKILEEDPVGKPQKFINNLMERGRVLAYGRVSSEAIFSKLPDGHKLRRDLILRLARSIEGAVSHADKQTKETRAIFSIPEALGIVVILNEHVRMLDPEIIRYALSNIFQKVSDTGARQYAGNHGVIVITEAHLVRVASPAKVFPILTFINPDGLRKDEVETFSAMLLIAWAKFNGFPVLHGTPKQFRVTPMGE